MEKQKSSKHKIQVAVVGCGYWGKNLIRNFYELGALNGICDVNTDAVSHFANEFSVNNLSLNDILSSTDIDAVVVATPANTHAKIAKEILESGKHVFIEKPIALDINDAKAIIKKGKEMNKHIMVGHILNYHPAFIQLSKMIREGSIGEILSINSSRLSWGKVRKEEDVIWSFAPHDISMILSLIKSKPIKTNVQRTFISNNSIADAANIQIQFENKTTANINVSWLSPIKENKLIITGDRGILIFDDIQSWDKKLSFCTLEHCNSDLLTPEKSSFAYIPIIESEPLKQECNHFLSLVANSEDIENITSGEEALKVLEILNSSS